ncbi:MAG: ScyD/ScyE family protein [Piscinibacter sp.]|nr:ScyD/ScyE family protein [Piscinibacter sp.]
MKTGITTAVAALALGLAATAPLRAAPYTVTEVMSGLVTPRGLAFGPDGALYVAEAGSGGGIGAPSIVLGNGNTAYLGATSAISRWSGGVQTRVVSGLASIATATGGDAGGMQDIVFDGTGQAYGLFGLGASPLARDASLGAAGAELGTIVRLSLDGSNARTLVADISAHEATNPDGGSIDSNPFGFAKVAGGGFIVADAGGNSFLQATSAGAVSTLGVIGPRPNPLFPFGPPTFQSVPTSVAVGADGAYYIGELTGFPFPPGAANVYRHDPLTATTSVAYAGFTNIVDIAFDAEGDLFVLQISSNGLASPSGPGTGVLIEIDGATGERTTIASDGLFFPGGLAIGNDGALYVTNLSHLPEGGQVLRIAEVPEPQTWSLLLAGIAALAWRTRVRRAG